MKTNLLLLLFLVYIATNIKATIITVPGDYSTIQSAINASTNGDTIVVSQGTYFENINFRGKNIFLTSLYYLASDTSYISSTIINGSTPINPDSASCVIFNSGEDTTAVLQGFTITGGEGTKWLDIHGAGLYREGGGILIELSSPTIKHNIITDNSANNLAGVSGAGGGGMRIGDSNPIICSNTIVSNHGNYGAGIVLNYTGCRLTNNIISSNTGGLSFYGGSGIWIYGDLNTTPKQIINNTITNNYSSLSSGTGGISVWSASNVIIRNNIIWNNLPPLQIKTSSAIPTVEYSDVQGGYTGTGNIDQDPLFTTQNYYLNNSSPCIDAGDTASIYNDIEDPNNLGYALFPSKVSLRNDMGAYGGPCTSFLPLFPSETRINENEELVNIYIYPNPTTGKIKINAERIDKVELKDINGKQIYKGKENLIDISKEPNGIYIIKVTSNDQTISEILIKQ